MVMKRTRFARLLRRPRHAPKRPPAAIEDLDLLVKVTGRPDAIRAYTAAEQSEAEAYAAAVGGVIEPLPTDA